MEAWGKQIGAIILLLLCCAGSAWAQDAGMSETDIPADTRSNADGDAVFVPGEDVKYIPRASAAVVSTDSIALQLQDFPMQRAAQRPADRTDDKQNGKKDDSILTFNFLYYIIQKYKLQDIID